MKILERRTVAVSFLTMGLALVLLAIFAKKIGVVGDGMKARAVAGMLGLVLLAIGCLRSRFTKAYTATCVLVANTVLLLMLIEGSAMVFARYKEYKRSVKSVEMVEARRASGVVRTLYTGWKGVPSTRPTITVLESGLRRTPPQTRVDHPPLRVFVFGGSTVWGEGATDEETIPAHLQAMLTEKLDYPVEAVNFGQRSWVSTQNLVQLMLELRRGNVPNLVVFYDGYNDGTAAVKRGQPGSPESLDVLNSTESAENTTLRLFRSTALGGLLTPNSGFKYEDVNAEELSVDIVKMYVSIQRIVIAVSREFDFEAQFYWQPQLIIGNKSLTDEEQQLHDTHRWLPPVVRQVTTLSYKEAAAVADATERFTDISDVFDSVKEKVFYDPCHVTGEGNRLVAARMLDDGVLESAKLQRDRLLKKSITE